MKQKRFRNAISIRELKCSCGGSIKKTKKTNYPFGVNSKSRTSTYYVCKSCKKGYVPESKENFQKH